MATNVAVLRPLPVAGWTPLQSDGNRKSCHGKWSLQVRAAASRSSRPVASSSSESFSPLEPAGPYGQGELGWREKLVSEPSIETSSGGGDHSGGLGGGSGGGDRGGGGGGGGHSRDRNVSSRLTSDEDEDRDRKVDSRPVTGPFFASVSSSSEDDADGGMLDWLSSVIHSLLSSRLEKLGDRPVDKQALMAETAELVMQLLDERSSDDAFVHRAEVSALRRLQREAFQDLLKLKERLDRLEVFTGVRKSSSTSSSSAPRTRLTGLVSAGAAFLPTDAQSSSSHAARAALERAGIRSGLTARFTFETSCRDGKDLLLTEATAGLGEDSSSFMLGGPLNLGRVVYFAQISEGLGLRLAPVGGRGDDMGAGVGGEEGSGSSGTLWKDSALTRFSSSGLPLLRSAHGSGLGLSFSSSSASLSLSQFLAGWGVTPDPESSHSSHGPGLCSSSLAQLSLRPHDSASVSFTALHRVWPAPPLPSAPGLHWSEMGPLVLPRLAILGGCSSKGGDVDSSASQASYDSPQNGGSSSRPGSGQGKELWALPDDPQPSATTLQSIAISGEVELGEGTKMAGWAQAENADWLLEEQRTRVQWGLSLSHKPEGGGGEEGAAAKDSWWSNAGGLARSVSYGLCLGSSQADAYIPVSGMSGGDSPEGQLQLEAFANIELSSGLNVQPGLVYARNKHSGGHSAFMLRSSWAL